MKNEKVFWESCNNTRSPGWDAKLSDHLTPGNMNLSDYDVYVYAIDTSTGWIAGGSLKSSEMKSIHLELSKSGLNKKHAQDEAGRLIILHGKSFPSAESAETQACISASVRALTSTQTYNLALPGGLDGHWIYMAYKMRDDSIVTRPVFFKHPSSGFVPPEDLKNVMRKVFIKDTTDENTSVYQQLKASGGIITSSEFLTSYPI